MREFRFGDVVINDESNAFVIAEIGHNHQGSLETAQNLIRAAANAGCSAVKLQKRDNRALFTKAGYNAPYTSENAYGATYGEHREALEFGLREYRECQKLAQDLGIVFFSTAFDVPSADFLADLNVPLIKVASGDIRSTPLLEHLAKLGIPVIFSTGGASEEDVLAAHEIFGSQGVQRAVLQCTAGYPPSYEELDLNVIPQFRSLFPNTVVGYSGHDSGIAMAVMAYALGARIVEKHFTLDRTMKGTDHAFSLEPKGMEKMIRDLSRAKLALGSSTKRKFESEIGPVKKMSKSIVASKRLEVGHVLTFEDLSFKSPGEGLSPNLYRDFVGQALLRAVDEDELLTLNHIAS